MEYPASTLLLFGVTGDLSRRMLLPSMFNLHADGLLPTDLTIVGTAQQKIGDDGLREVAAAALEPIVRERGLDSSVLDRFLARLSYIAADASDAGSFEALGEVIRPHVEGGLAIFLSTAPSLFESTIAGLERAGLAGSAVRLALEKPLGGDLETSRAINDAVAAVFPEGRTFRIDHYLGKETVQNLLALRFGNALFEPLWNAQGIEHVQITVAETVGLEGRTSYFDGMGSLRDMVQNHMLQLLSLVAMEAPAAFTANAIRDEKVKVLHSLRPIGIADVQRETVIGQYVAGAVGGRPVCAYTEELGGPSNTETFVAIKAYVDNWRWHSVPFYLRTGKRLPTRRSEIVIQFRGVPHSIFPGRTAVLQPNRLVISIQPEENLTLTLMAKQPGLDRGGIRLREVPLAIGTPNAFADVRKRIAYERLLIDLIEGLPTLFVRRDEVEAQWQWIDAIRDGWLVNGMLPKAYGSGSWGPAAAIALTERDGVSWNERGPSMGGTSAW